MELKECKLKVLLPLRCRLTVDRFRWVSLQIQNLCDFERIKHESDVRNELGKLPKTLKASYDVIYDRVKQSGLVSRSVADTTIKWLLAAQRPLSTEAMLAAVSSMPDGKTVSLCTSELLDMCCNLVVEDSELDIFRFGHLSVREYFEGRAGFDENEIHTCALDSCAQVYSENAERDRTGFSSYAAFFWPIHFQFIEADDLPDRLRKILNRFLVNYDEASSPFARWLAMVTDEWGFDDYSYRGEVSNCQSSPPNPLFVACAFDLMPLMTYLDKTGNVDWGCRNKYMKTPLHVAASCGHEEIVRYLCERGATLESRDRAGYTPLHSAAFSGRRAVIEELLHHGADIEALDTFNKTPLHVVAYKDNVLAARMLIERGANLEAKDKNNWTALHFSLYATARPLSQMVLETGVDSEAKTSFGAYASQLAATSRASETLYSLLKKGANTEATTSDGWTSLHLAAASVQTGAVRLLLKFGADVTKKTNEGKKALELAKDDTTRELLREAEALVDVGHVRWFHDK